MAKIEKVYKIINSTDRGRTYEFEGTLVQLIECFSYTLECGACYQHEKGRKKINKQPKTIKSLITNLYNAGNNSAANGYAGESYDFITL